MALPPDTTNQPVVRFSNEKLLQQATASLLTRMPDVGSVQILQGAQEYGKDIVFRVDDAFGDRIWCACVVKNTRIRGKVGDSQSARILFDQIEQALDTPFNDQAGVSRRCSKAYVICPHQTGIESLNSIAGKMQSRFGQVQFKTGADLFSLFRQYWPAFLADERAALEDALARELDTDSAKRARNNIAFLYDLGDVPVAAENIYVPVGFKRNIVPLSLRGEFENLVDQQRLKVGHVWSVEHVASECKRLASLSSKIDDLAEWRIVDDADATVQLWRFRVSCG